MRLVQDGALVWIEAPEDQRDVPPLKKPRPKRQDQVCRAIRLALLEDRRPVVTLMPAPVVAAPAVRF